MTREEAIKMLDKWYGLFPSEAYEALDMAIEALNCSETPNGSTLQNLTKPNKNCEVDLISRQDAIDALTDFILVDYPTRKLAQESAEMVIGQVPSAEPKTGECKTCKRSSDYRWSIGENDTRCPIEEHYALPKDGYCHLYEPYREDDEE